MTKYLLFFAFGMAAMAQNPYRGDMWTAPDQSQTNAARSAGPCQDPWITIMIWRRQNRGPIGYQQEGECAVANYNGGSWNGFSQLSDAYADYWNSLNAAQTRLVLLQLSSSDVRVATVSTNPNLLQSLFWFTAGGQRIIAVGGNNIIAVGGNNIIAVGGNNIIAAGGGNVINGNGSTMSLAVAASKVADMNISTGYAVSASNPGIPLGKGKSSMLFRRR